MKARSCAELAELRSAYVDGALADADRERLLTHLVDCPHCRRDVAELRHVRLLLNGSTDPGRTPVDLSYRLVSIAGEQAQEPLWTRPFRRTPRGGLPSHRHAVRTRALAGILGCGLAVLAALGVGYVAAPADSVAAVADPTGQAVTEFTAAVSTFPLDGRVSAALHGQRPSPASAGGTPRSMALPAKGFSEAKATRLLVQAGHAGDELSYSGVQVVSVTRDDRRLSNTVRVSSWGGKGTELRPNGTGRQPASGDTYVKSDSSSRMADADLIDRLANRYVLRGWMGQRYGGRAASVVEAVEPTAAAGAGAVEGVMARWWIDAENGLLLAQEAYDGQGALVVSSKLTELQMKAVADDTPAAPGPAVRTTTTLTLSRAGDLRRDGWICAGQLAGLRLLRLRTDQPNDPALVHLVYSEGLTTVSVVEQRGRLAGAPAGTRNETLGAWVRDGMPTTATWTSGDVVLTVVTDGSRETLAAAVAALPHDVLQTPTTMERVRAGWSRILGR